ncbi:AAA family ATPase [Kitasatospora sp. NPDC004723]|uniref:ATP-binding protein n=1 Tax=Kitasatospora sp. NPDC004723 TaxID=3154288 RepID=UPI0033A499A0
MRLIERERELSVLTRLVRGCINGAGGVAVVTGAVASGKTALLQRLAKHAVANGAVFLSATGWRAERTLPLGLVRQLLYGVDVPDGGVELVQALLDGTLAATLYEADNGFESGSESAWAGTALPASALHGLCKVFLNLTERSPVVIAVDDAHHADLASLSFLRYLVRRLTTARILVVFTQSSRLKFGRTTLQTEFLRQFSSTSLHLGPLSPRGVADLLADYLDNHVAQRLAADCHQVSGGNPLIVRALAEDYRAFARRTPDQCVFGDVFSRAVTACLLRSESSMRQAAKALAILGEHATRQALEEMLELSGEATADIVNALGDVGLLEDGWFRHEGIRAAILNAMPHEEYAAQHTRAAKALHNLGAPARDIGRHLIAAEGPEAPWHLRTLRQAADEALCEGDVNFAIRCLRMAYGLCTDLRQRAGIRSALLRAEWRVNPLAVARHLPELTEAGRQGLLNRRDTNCLAGHYLWHGQPEQALEILDASAANCGTPSPRSARLLASQVFPGLAFGWSEAPDPAADQGLYFRVASALATVLTGGDDSCVAAAVDTAEEALQSCRLDDDTLTVVVTALTTLVYAKGMDRAAFWSCQLVNEAARRRAPMWQALLAAVQSVIHTRRGSFPEAEECARTALTLVPAPAWGVVVGVPIAGALLATVAQGRIDDAACYVAMTVPEAMFRTASGLHYLEARAHYYLATNRVHAALGDFQRCGELMESWGIDVPTVVPWRVGAAATYLRLGRTREARELLDDQLTRLGPRHVRTRGMSLRLLAAIRSEPADRLPLVTEAVEQLRNCDDKYEQMLAVADLSRVHRMLGENGLARLQARRAHRLAEQCGVALPADKLFAESAGLLAHGLLPQRYHEVAPVNELSDAERRVAALAVHGHTNRQIADKLFITVSTVEQHLTRVYRKLRVARRSDLPLDLQSDVVG